MDRRTASLTLTPILILSLSAFSCDLVSNSSRSTTMVVSTASEAGLSVEVLTALSEQAALFAVRNHGGEQVWPPAAPMAAYYRALLCLENARGKAGFPIEMALETFPGYPPLHEVLMGVSPTFEWTSNLLDGIAPTGHPIFDGLVDEYDLQVSAHEYSHSTLVILTSPAPLDMQVLAGRMADLDGVLYAEPNGLGGDGNRATGSILSSGVELVFSRGWGDCPAGCIYRHYWKYRVLDDRIVEFGGEWGDPVP